MKLIKYIGIAFLIGVAGLICLLIFISIIFSSDQEDIDYKELIKSKEFRDLHNTVATLDGVSNIAILPEKQYVVIDGLVINLIKRTFGVEPALGFYISYYQEGDKTSYSSLDSLLKGNDIKFDSVKLMSLIDKMRYCKTADIMIGKKEISYRWKVSAMYGEEGLIYSPTAITKDSILYDIFEPIEDNFYHFAIYDR